MSCLPARVYKLIFHSYVLKLKKKRIKKDYFGHYLKRNCQLPWSSICHLLANSYLDNLESAIHDSISNVFLDLRSIELRFDFSHSNANFDLHCYFSRCFVSTNTRWKFSQHLPNWNQSSRVHKWFSKIKSKSRFQREFHTGEVIVQGDEFFQFQNVWQETT